MKVIQV